MEIRPGDTFFLDTNVLLAATDEGRSEHDDARRLLTAASERGAHLAVSGQVLREYLVVATRPVSNNGLGLDRESALRNVDAFGRRAVRVEETSGVWQTLRRLLTSHSIAGKRIHDANVAATVLAHRLSGLVTNNVEDFEAFDGIEAITPRAACRILAGGSG